MAVIDTSGPDRSGRHREKCFDVRALLATAGRPGPAWADRLARRCRACAHRFPSIRVPRRTRSAPAGRLLVDVVKANLAPGEATVRIVHDLLIVRHAPSALERVEAYLQCLRAHP